jgi:hypothetical protein
MVERLRLYCRLALAAGLAWTGYAVAADTPQSFTVQGRLFDPAGDVPLSETVSIKFTIFARTGATTECLLYEELQTGIDLSLTDGVFATEVGSVTGSSRRVTPNRDPGLSMAEVFANTGSEIRPDDSATTNTCPGGFTPAAGESRRLRVTVIRSGGSEVVLAPDQVIGAVPSSQVAQTLQGLDPDSFIQVGGDITLQNLTTLVDGSDASSLHHHDSLYLPVGGSGPKDLGSGVTFTQNGTLGIGTSSPSSRVEVRTATASQVGLIVQRSASQTANLLEIRNEAGTALLQVDASGQVILPNATPTLAHHAAAKAYVDAQVLMREAPLTFSAPLARAGDTISVAMASGVSNGVLAASDYLRFGRGEMLQSRAVSASAPASGAVLTWSGTQWEPQVSAASQWTTIGQDIYFGNGTGNGFVGINTALPGERLEVVGNVLVEGNVRVKDPDQWLGYSGDANLSYASSSASLQIKTPSTDPLTFVWANGSSVSEKVRFTAGGRIGVGNASPSAWLHLPASSSAASSAPIKLAQGVLMTTPEAGAIEFDGSNLYYTNTAGARQQLSSTAPGVPYFPTMTAGDIQTDSLEVLNADFIVDTDKLVVSAGNVGIGTATPASPLDVLGDARFRNLQSSSSYFDFNDLSNDGTQSLAHTTADGSARILASRGSTASPCTVIGESASGPVGCGGLTGPIALTSAGLSVAGLAIGGHATAAGNQSLLIGTPDSQPSAGFGASGSVDLGTASFAGSAFSGVRPSMRYTAQSHLFRTNAGSGQSNPGTDVVAVTSTGLGIGTTTPDAAIQAVGANFHFDTSGGGNLKLRDSSSGSAQQSILFQRGTSTQAAISNDGSDRLVLETDGTDLLFKTGSSAERMRIEASSGRLGVGTASPAAGIHAATDDSVQNASSTVMVLEHTSSLAAQAGIGSGLEFRAENDAGGSVASSRIEGILSDVTDAAEKGALVFRTRASSGTMGERARITDQGRLGIGTSAPGQLLDVSGGARIFDQTATTGSTTLTVRAGAGQSTTELVALQQHNGTTAARITANQIDFVAGGSVKFTDASSLVGASSTVMTLAGASPPNGLGLQSSNHISFAPGGTTELVRIDSSGRLGLGTAVSSPQALVHLAGAANTVLRIDDGQQAAGKFLGSDASGNASWQTLPASSGGTVTLVTGTAPVSVANGSTTPTISMAQATGSASGYLASADWATFNNKQRAGNYIINASGDVSTDSGSYDSNPASATYGQVNLSVQKLRGYAISSTGPSSNGQVLKWNSAANGGQGQWEPGTDNGATSQWTTSGSDIYYSAGNVGLGTSTPGDQLTLTANLQLGSSSRIKRDSSRFIHATGSLNFFAGVDAGPDATSGVGRNTGVGASALTGLSSGTGNTALGARSLQNVSTGVDNTAVGRGALLAATSDHNAAVGAGALGSIIDGEMNTAVGSAALSQNVSGDQNVAIGKDAGAANAGSGNVFIGHSAGSAATGDNKLYIANSSTNHLIVGDFAADSGLGRVGIGLGSSNSPTATLHVDGSVRLKIGTPSANQVLTTDASGNATWASPQYTGTVSSVTAQAGTPLSVATGSSTPVISISQAATGSDGYLSSTDWNTFNSKQPAGNYIVTLTGDATSSGFSSGSVAVTLANSGVTAGTYTKLTVDSKGRATTGGSLAAADIPAPGGDASGTYASMTVSRIRNRSVASTAPRSNQVLGWNSSANAGAGQWEPMAGGVGLWTAGTGVVSLGLGYTSVGIGTAVPGAQLHVMDDIGLEPTQASTIGVIRQEGLSLLHTYDHSGMRTNLFLGSEAGNFGGRGNYNVGIGTQALASFDTGSSNTAVGSGALVSLVDGSSNTVVGDRAGSSLVDGNSNTLVGALSGQSLISGANNVAIGELSLNVATSAADSVAIGSSALSSLTTGTGNSALGFAALTSVAAGTSNTAIGYKAGYQSTGSGNVFIGYQAGGGVSAGDSKLYVANSSVKTLIYGDFSADRVGIATTSPAATFQVGVSGDGTTTRANAWTTFSDERLKKNVTRIEDGLEGIIRLSGYRYDWREGRDRSRQVGVLAQEVEEIFPEVVSRGNDGILSVAYDKLVAPLIEAVKELASRGEVIDERVRRLEAENAELKKRLERLEKAVGLERAPASK